MYLVRSGSLTVVARTAREVLRIQERLEDFDVPRVQITDMNGFAVDIEPVAGEVTNEKASTQIVSVISCSAMTSENSAIE